MRRTLPIALVLMIGSWTMAFGQLGGLNTYEFLNLSPSARVTALGANLITIVDDDINLALANPSLLNPAMHQQLSFSHNFHLAGIDHGYAAYGQHFNSIGTTFHAGVQYVNYGDFDQTDEFGNVLGTFAPAEYALTIGAAKPLYERMTVGANLKFISSQFEAYNSFGVAADVAAVFRDTASRFTATIVFKNMGSQITTFREDNFEDLPFEIQIGISKRLRYLPFRFSIIYQQAQRWNIIYDDPNSDEPTLFLGEEASDDSDVSIFFDNLFRHFIFNGEFLFGKSENFRVRFGYNHFRRRELSVENFRSLAGFSFGAGIKINRFRIDYGYGSFHIGGGVNHLTISTNLREFRK
ncbi:MAG: type IX secretion system protein PorQ [Bacteroidota bacterium]